MPLPPRLAGTAWGSIPDRRRTAPRPRFRIRLPDLPPDVRADEVTWILCFRASLLLNRVCRGDPGMTFSARSYREYACGTGTGRRLFWALTYRTINLSCAILRGEAYHCEAALANHLSR